MGQHVAIVGAGIAGLSASRLLRRAGVACTLFDKSRGLGGRMARRRVGDLCFDHGAQYFTAKGERFSALVEEWRVLGSAKEWFDGAFVGAPAMTAPAHALAEGCDIVAACEVRALRRGDEGWTLLASDGPVVAPGNGRFTAVLMALPAPQVAPILATAGLSFREIAEVRYAPCWALMLAFAGRMDLAWTTLRDASTDIPWIARNASKPDRGGDHETFVVHAGADWTRRYLECAPEWVIGQLRPLFVAASGVAQEPVFAAAHRWRFALVETPAGVPCLWNEAAGVGACGDWCIGPRVEAAFDSGEAMAQAILNSLGGADVR